jgi:hypothetical protein
VISLVLTSIGQKRTSEKQTPQDKRMKFDISLDNNTFEHFELSDLENSFNNLIDYNAEIDFGEDHSRLLSDFLEEEFTQCGDEHTHIQVFNLKTNLKFDFDDSNKNIMNIELKINENNLKEREGLSKNTINHSNSILYVLLNKNKEDVAVIKEKGPDSHCKGYVSFKEADPQNKDDCSNVMDNLLKQSVNLSYEEDLCSEDLKEVAVPINVTLKEDLKNSIIDLTESASEEKSETNKNRNCKASFVESEKNSESKSCENMFTEESDRFLDINKYDVTNDTLYGKIKNFISKSVCETQENHYISLLNRIKENISHLNEENDPCIENKSVNTREYDILCIEALVELHHIYRKMGVVDFFSTLNRYLKSSETFNAIYDMMSNLSIYQKNFLMHSEFIKFYEYLDEILELLFVGINLPRYFSDKIFSIICLINKFLESNKSNLKKHKKFVLLFIVRTFESFNTTEFFFLFNKPLYTGCHEKHPLLFCFLLAVHERIRCNLKKNITLNKELPYNLSNTENKHVKSVLLLILYQNLISMEHRNIDKQGIQTCKKLITTVIRSNKCSVCLPRKTIKF